MQAASPGRLREASYSASKFALRAFADALRNDEPALRVTTVYPGRVDTDMQRELQAAEGREYDPSIAMEVTSVARAIVFALEAPADAAVESLSIRPTSA